MSRVSYTRAAKTVAIQRINDIFKYESQEDTEESMESIHSLDPKYNCVCGGAGACHCCRYHEERSIDDYNDVPHEDEHEDEETDGDSCSHCCSYEEGYPCCYCDAVPHHHEEHEENIEENKTPVETPKVTLHDVTTRYYESDYMPEILALYPPHLRNDLLEDDVRVKWIESILAGNIRDITSFKSTAKWEKYSMIVDYYKNHTQDAKEFILDCIDELWADM